MGFPFLRRHGVAWHDDPAENHARPGVLHWTIRGGRRSWRDAWVLERLRSTYRTWRIRKVSFPEVVREALRGKGDPPFAPP